MIKVKLFKENWRIEIGDEAWEFVNLKEMLSCLQDLCIMKEKYGKLPRGRENE